MPEIPWVNVLIGPRMVEMPAFIGLGLWIVFQLISGIMHMLRSGRAGAIVRQPPGGSIGSGP